MEKAYKEIFRSSIGDVPWGNLFRWVVSSYLFTLVFFFGFVFPISFLVAGGQTFSTPPEATPVVIILGAIVAAIVVWSEDIPWPGDP